MPDGFSVLSLSQSGLLGLVVLFILTDRLVPRRRLADKMKLIEKREERIEQQDLLVKELTEQNTLLLQVVPLINSTMDALQKKASGETEGR
jgi:hypothetical protein